MLIRRGVCTISTCFNFHNILRYCCCSLFLLILLFITFATFHLSDHDESIDNFRAIYPGLYENSFKNEKGKKCHFPDLDPWDSSVSDYLKNGGDLSCKMLQYDLTFVNESNFLILNRTALKLSGFEKSNIDCRYRCFDSRDDVKISTSEVWHIFEWETPLPDDECEFLEVDCSRKISSLLSVYSNIHFRMIEKSSSNTAATNFRNRERKPNVLLFVIDSQSKSNVERYLPKMSKILNDSDYLSVRMDGFVKIGDNSFPNAIAFLTGKRSCVPGYPDELPCYMGDDYFDDWPLIWRNFSAAGYKTYYAEDHPDFNLFQYTYNGFRRKPVDHYFRPYWLKVWQTFLHRRSSHLCFGNTPKHLLQLDYLERFFKAYQKQDSPLFALNWLTELGHDWLGQISLGDHDFEQFFQRMKSLLLKNTIIFTFSDHGHRFDSIRKTSVGRLEERMPYLSISLPENLRTKFPNLWRNLLLNSKRLTSPFDIYATLVDILNSDFGDPAHPKDNAPSIGNFGKSLFRPVPENRQCSEAGIPREYCVCEREISIADPQNDRLVILAAKNLIDYLNDQLLTDYANLCAKLTLKQINNANIFADRFYGNIDRRKRSIFAHFSELFDRSNSEPKTLNFRITIESDPSGAIFEALFRYSLSENTFKLIGDVNRINKYGNQSVCVNSPLLRKYCFCTDKSL